MQKTLILITDVIKTVFRWTYIFIKIIFKILSSIFGILNEDSKQIEKNRKGKCSIVQIFGAILLGTVLHNITKKDR